MPSVTLNIRYQRDVDHKVSMTPMFRSSQHGTELPSGVFHLTRPSSRFSILESKSPYLTNAGHKKSNLAFSTFDSNVRSHYTLITLGVSYCFTRHNLTYNRLETPSMSEMFTILVFCRTILRKLLFFQVFIDFQSCCEASFMPCGVRFLYRFWLVLKILTGYFLGASKNYIIKKHLKSISYELFTYL
jgi:hypothetical protein